MTSLFSLGQVVATSGALEALERAGDMPEVYLGRHERGDWGDVCEEDWKDNEFSVNRNLRLFSTYTLSDGETKLWIITEADRSATTLLLPSEY